MRHVQRNEGARGLIGNTYPVPRGHTAAVVDDVYLWQYFHQRTNRCRRWGHTPILNEVNRAAAEPGRNRNRVTQGSLLPVVPD